MGNSDRTNITIFGDNKDDLAQFKQSFNVYANSKGAPMPTGKDDVGWLSTSQLFFAGKKPSRRIVNQDMLDDPQHG